MGKMKDALNHVRSGWFIKVLRVIGVLLGAVAQILVFVFA
jgi:hypothetical protein